MKALSLLITVLLLLSISACTQFGEDQIKAWKLIKQGALIIDVRSNEEFAGGHLDNAINIEYENIQLLAKTIGSDKNRSVVFYCRSGRRANVAIDELNKMGYSNIFNGQGLSSMQAALEHKNEVKP